MKKLILSLIALGMTPHIYSQITELPAVEIMTVNYKYYDAVHAEDTAEPINRLQKEVALYDLKESDLYRDEYDTYYISFYLPEGKIVASYDKDGKVLRTIERYKDIDLPTSINMAVSKRFPGWVVTKDIYKVSYNDYSGTTKAQYKLRIENGDESLRIKMDDEGNFL